MKNTAYYKNKKVTVIGLARSGLASANLLFELGAKVSATDAKDDLVTRKNASCLKSSGIQVELGKHSREFIQGRDLVVVSPGVPDQSPAVTWAIAENIPMISEIEFAFSVCPATVIAITGSNGKTTVTTLIGHALQASGKKAFVCGNIGNPFSGAVREMAENDFVSLEISSFQLEKIKTFKPKIAVLLNFSRNHLDRYVDMGEYLAAKKRIYMNQGPSDYLVLNNQEVLFKELAAQAVSRVAYFQETAEFNPNQAAVLTVAGILGIGIETVKKVFRGFKGVEHRLEKVAEINKVCFINDSKATTAESTIWALRNILQPVILIAGGKDKGIDYRIIADMAKQKVKKAILIGEAKPLINSALEGVVPIEEAVSLEEAVQKAQQNAIAGDCVLLSPMCSSYDMFSDYEERGRVFKKAVHNLR